MANVIGKMDERNFMGNWCTNIANRLGTKNYPPGIVQNDSIRLVKWRVLTLKGQSLVGVNRFSNTSTCLTCINCFVCYDTNMKPLPWHFTASDCHVYRPGYIRLTAIIISSSPNTLAVMLPPCDLLPIGTRNLVDANFPVNIVWDFLWMKILLRELYQSPWFRTYALRWPSGSVVLQNSRSRPWNILSNDVSREKLQLHSNRVKTDVTRSLTVSWPMVSVRRDHVSVLIGLGLPRAYRIAPNSQRAKNRSRFRPRTPSEFTAIHRCRSPAEGFHGTERRMLPVKKKFTKWAWLQSVL